MHNVIQSKCACMDSDVTDPNDDEGSLDEAEQDEVLFEYAGDILPSLGQALSDPEKFKTYFAGMLTHLVKKTKPRYATKLRLFGATNFSVVREFTQLTGDFSRQITKSNTKINTFNDFFPHL